MQLFAVFYLGLQCGREGGQAGGPRRPLAEMPHLRLRLPRLVALLKHVSPLTHWYCGPHASIDSTGIMNLQKLAGYCEIRNILKIGGFIYTTIQQAYSGDNLGPRAPAGAIERTGVAAALPSEDRWAPARTVRPWTRPRGTLDARAAARRLVGRAQ